MYLALSECLQPVIHHQTVAWNGARCG